VITDIDLPTNPGAKTYSIHALADIDLDLSTPGFVQRPACGYNLNQAITWSFTPSPASALLPVAGAPYKLKISSKTNSHAGVFQATLRNAVTYSTQSWNPSISFQVTVVDPCLTTVISPFTIGTVTAPMTYGVITQEAGQTINT